MGQEDLYMFSPEFTGDEEIDHEYTSEIVCPYCGYEFADSWEYNGDDGMVECDNCEKNFIYRRIVTVEYSTEKCDCVNAEAPHIWMSVAIEVSGKTLQPDLYKCKKCYTYKKFPDETREQFETTERLL